MSALLSTNLPELPASYRLFQPVSSCSSDQPCSFSLPGEDVEIYQMHIQSNTRDLKQITDHKAVYSRVQKLSLQRRLIATTSINSESLHASKKLIIQLLNGSLQQLTSFKGPNPMHLSFELNAQSRP